MSLTSTLLLGCAESTLNALLARDPAAPSRLRRLAGKRLLLRLERPRFDLLMGFDERGLTLLRPDQAEESDADAIVEIDSDALSALLGGESLEHLMFSGRLAVRGEIALLEGARTLLMDIDLDWEGALAEWFGDQPGHSLAEGMRRFARFGLRSQRELRADIADFVFEEARLLPGQGQREALRDYLTELEIATDRLEARVNRLQRKLASRQKDIA
ncbi:ubiquinone biosynthesis protein UbiJ [Modicisalibacter ilicicola DSM 19980]|uniref:Ubiquinone biosynthesis accessory factor UbiJ n=1 Tax=Modicisalibacter ilicicola DSM 19980 TaxID=1121942 RepID=A0A1M4V2Z2_9GAMM|nr:SCP2 sterol-binding domain-containing protein [Halomonas ilicicola]SHE63346.1 ubiquinone biosynthesis protein UbiJ [Halomonas ilicicola DSM 19980]